MMGNTHTQQHNNKFIQRVCKQLEREGKMPWLDYTNDSDDEISTTPDVVSYDSESSPKTAGSIGEQKNECNGQSSEDGISSLESSPLKEQQQQQRKSQRVENRRRRKTSHPKSLHHYHLSFCSSSSNDDSENLRDKANGKENDHGTSINDEDARISIGNEKVGAEDDDDNDDDDESVFQLQEACKETNKVGVGSIVRVSLERRTWKKRRTTKRIQKWGTIVEEHTEEVFDVQSEGKVLKGVKIGDMHTMESSQLKDEKLGSKENIGKIVYAAWPGIDPKNEQYYWGRIKQTKVQGTKVLFTIIFFPSPGGEDFYAGPVDVTEELASDFFHREKEAKYLMEERVVATSELPASAGMTLQELIQLRQEQTGVASADEQDHANDNEEEDEEDEESPSVHDPDISGNGGNLNEIIVSPYESQDATAEVDEPTFVEMKNMLCVPSNDQGTTTTSRAASRLLGKKLADNVSTAFSLIGQSGILFDPQWVDGKILGQYLGWIPKPILLLCLHEERFVVQDDEKALYRVVKHLDLDYVIADSIAEYRLDREYINLSSNTSYTYTKHKTLCYQCEIFVARAFRSVKVLKRKKIEPSLWQKIHDCLTIMNARVRVAKNGVAIRLAELEEDDALAKSKKSKMDQKVAATEIHDDNDDSQNSEVEQGDVRAPLVAGAEIHDDNDEDSENSELEQDEVPLVGGAEMRDNDEDSENSESEQNEAPPTVVAQMHGGQDSGATSTRKRKRDDDPVVLIGLFQEHMDRMQTIMDRLKQSLKQGGEAN